MARINAVKIEKNLSLHELECKDGQNLVKVHPRLPKLFQKFRDEVSRRLGKDTSVIINSAFRTKSHNAKVGGSPNSQHVKGTALDIRKIPGMSIGTMAKIAEQVGFDGIGTYSWGIHVDVRGYRARWSG